MSPKTFIFIGRSGCGKGTQAKLVQEYLKKQDPEREVFYLQTGAAFREFIKGNTLTQRLSKEIYDRGGLQPEFLAIHMWSSLLVDNMKEDQHLLIDGTPRKLHEAGALHSVFSFYNREKPNIVYLNVSREWSEKRLLERGRFDDNDHDIKARLDWFDTEVAPAVEYYRDNPDYNFIDTDGEKMIEEIHEDVIKRIK